MSEGSDEEPHNSIFNEVGVDVPKILEKILAHREKKPIPPSPRKGELHSSPKKGTTEGMQHALSNLISSASP